MFSWNLTPYIFTGDRVSIKMATIKKYEIPYFKKAKRITLLLSLHVSLEKPSELYVYTIFPVFSLQNHVHSPVKLMWVLFSNFWSGQFLGKIRKNRGILELMASTKKKLIQKLH